MKKSLVISCLALAVLTACQTTSTQTSESAQLPAKLVISPSDNRSYQTLTLENGIDVMLVSDPSVEKSAAALSVGVGLLNDPMTQQGMAHYLEHMLFLGTERYPGTQDYSEFMTKHGGAHNAYTWLDITNYMFKVNNDAYDDALDRFSDFFKAPMLYPEYTEKEKNAVNAEWSMRREMDFFGQFKLARLMMSDHPANRFLIGNLESLGDKPDSKLHEQTVAFYNRYYSSNIMKVALVSNLPLDQMADLAKKHFASIKNKAIEKPKVSTKLNFEGAGKKRVYYKPNQDVKQLKLDFTIENNSDQFALKPNHYITYLLSNEMQGSPAQVLRDKGWVASLTANASPDMYGNYGSLSVNVELTDEGMANREAIVAVVMQYIELIKKQGVDPRYFDEIRTSLDNQFRFLEKQDEFGYVADLTASMQNYPLQNTLNAPYYYARFDAKAIENVLAQLTPEHLRIWYISKDEQTDSTLHFYDGEYRIAPLPDEEIASWQQASQFALALPTVNRMLPEHFALKNQGKAASDKPVLSYDRNGIKIWSQPSLDFANQPKGQLDVYFNNGEGLADIKASVGNLLWADLYNLQQSALSTEAAIAGMSVGLEPLNGPVLGIGGFTDKQALLLKEALGGLRIDLDKQGFDQAVDRFVRALQNKQKEFPFYQAFGELKKLTRTGSYDTEALIKAAQSMTPADLKAQIDRTLARQQLRVLAFGNYDQADIEALAATLTSALPKKRSSSDYARSKAWLPQAGETLVLQKDIDVADVAVIDLLVHPVPGYKQKAQAQVLQRHFSNMAFDKLRTEEQLAYAVGAFARPIEDYATIGLYIQSPVKGPAEIQARFDEFKQQYAGSLANMDETTFEQLKNATLVALKEPPKNLQDELTPLITDWYRENFAFDSKAKLIAEVEKVTLADIRAFYRQTVLSDNAPRVNIQLRGTKFADAKFADLPGQIRISDLASHYGRIALQP